MGSKSFPSINLQVALGPPGIPDNIERWQGECGADPIVYAHESGADFHGL